MGALRAITLFDKKRSKIGSDRWVNNKKEDAIGSKSCLRMPHNEVIVRPPWSFCPKGVVFEVKRSLSGGVTFYLKGVTSTISDRFRAKSYPRLTIYYCNPNLYKILYAIGRTYMGPLAKKKKKLAK